jgi:predicted aldo/keto reductase-like oxidoreductase
VQEADEQTAIDTVHAAYAAGINFFDVSPYYGSGRAEQVGLCAACVMSGGARLAAVLLSATFALLQHCCLV